MKQESSHHNCGENALGVDPCIQEFADLRTLIAGKEEVINTRIDNVVTLIHTYDKNYLDKFQDSKESVTTALASANMATSAAFAAQKELTNQAFIAAQNAIEKSEMAVNKHFDSVNEFRATLSDQTKSFTTQSDHDALRRELALLTDRNTVDIKNLQLSAALLAGKASQGEVNKVSTQAFLGIILGISGLILALLNTALRLTGY